MTSHTDDLVARLREVEEWFHGRRSGKLEAARTLREAIEALTSQQHTEPVAGEVEVVGWRCLDLIWGKQPYLTSDAELVGYRQQRPGDWEIEPLIRKSSYDALAVVKDREIAAARESEEQATDCFKEANARALAAERQRDALLETLGDCQRALAMLVEPGQIVGTSLQAAWAICVAAEAKARAALKDEGSAT